MNIRKYIYNNHWTLGFIDCPIKNIINGDKYQIKWLENPYKNRWFADPFLLNITDAYYDVLVEEFYDPINRGRISRLQIDRRNMKIDKIIPVLELPTHLSFPAILRVNDSIFLYPENSASGKLELYRYLPDSNKCIFERTLSELPLTDAVLTSVFGERMIFSTYLPFQNGDTISFFKENDGLYLEKGKIKFGSNIARNAGDWFDVDGVVYRPAQDCSERYGGAVILQKVTRKNGTFLFENMRRIEENYSSYALGCHTFNYYNGVAVIDVNGYRHPILANTMKKITAFRKTFLK